MPHSLLVFEKDLRQFRLILLSWLGVVCVTQGVALLGGTVLSAQLMVRIILPLVLQWLAVLQAVLIFILVPMVVQSDPVVGTTAFWFTRPVSRRSLLRAKCVLVGSIFVGFPLLLEIPVLMLSGLGWKDVLPAAVLIILEKSVLVVPVFLMASITERFYKFVLAGLASFLGAVAVWPFVSAWVRGFFIDGNPSGWIGQASPLIPEMAAVSLQQKALIVFVGAVLIRHQYITRRTGRTVAGILAGVLLIPVAHSVLSHGFLQQEADSLAPSRVVFQAGKATVAEEMIASNRLERERLVSVPIYMQGLRPGQFAVLRTVFNPIVVFGPDVKLRSSGPLVTSRISISSRQLQAPIQFALKDFIVMNPYVGPDNSHAIMRLPEKVYDQYQNRSGTYDGQGLFDVYAYQVSARMPLVPGAKASAGGKESVVLDVIEKPSGVTVIVGEKTVNASWASLQEAARTGRDASFDFTGTYILAHPVRREAFLIDIVDQPGTRIDLAWPAAPDRLGFQVKRYDFSSINTGGSSAEGFKKSWLKEAELLRLDAQMLGVFKRELRFSGFILPEVSGLRK